MKKEYNLLSEYKKLKARYDLPEYDGVSQDFDIEKIQEREPTLLVREVRRTMNEKIIAYMHFFEMLINPVSPPLFMFPIIKKIKKDVSEKINKTYKIFSKFQIESMKLDTIYNEEKEAEFVRDFFKEWQKIKKEIYEIIDKFSENLEEIEEHKNSGYFG